MSTTTVATLPAVFLAQIPTGDDRKDPPPEVTAQFDQLGGWFYWFVFGALALAGVLAGVYLAVAYRNHDQQLSEGEKRIALVAVCATVVGTSGLWAPILL